MAKPLALAALVPLLLAGYGLAALSNLPKPAGKPLRMGLVQSNLVYYESQRQEKARMPSVREILNTHFAMSYDAVERKKADGCAVGSETAYPTTFGQPKSQAGAEFDREILSIVNSARVPFVFGTYDLDTDGEYNAAAFVNPDRPFGHVPQNSHFPAHRVRTSVARRPHLSALATVGWHLAKRQWCTRVPALSG